VPSPSAIDDIPGASRFQNDNTALKKAAPGIHASAFGYRCLYGRGIRIAAPAIANAAHVFTAM